MDGFAGRLRRANPEAGRPGGGHGGADFPSPADLPKSQPPFPSTQSFLIPRLLPPCGLPHTLHPPARPRPFIPHPGHRWKCQTPSPRLNTSRGRRRLTRADPIDELGACLLWVGLRAAWPQAWVVASLGLTWKVRRGPRGEELGGGGRSPSRLGTVHCCAVDLLLGVRRPMQEKNSGRHDTCKAGADGPAAPW